MTQPTTQSHVSGGRDICRLAEEGCLGAKHPKLFELVCSDGVAEECRYRLAGTPISDEKLCSAYENGCPDAESPFTFMYCCIKGQNECIRDYIDSALRENGEK